MLKKFDLRMWTGFIWLRIWSSNGLLWKSLWTFMFHEWWGIAWQVYWLL